jgi:hypothetical protein
MIGSVLASLKFTNDSITQPTWIALATLGQLDNPLGYRQCERICAIKVQGKQGILKRCRQRRNVLRTEYGQLCQKRLNRHSIAPNSAAAIVTRMRAKGCSD